jgi:hypothetical protein
MIHGARTDGEGLFITEMEPHRRLTGWADNRITSWPLAIKGHTPLLLWFSVSQSGST